jgi:phosphohistidine phosphatase
LLRHAKSSWDDGDLDDLDRPLSERGERDAPRMGERLRRLAQSPALIVTSHAARAKRTADLVAAALGLPRDGVRIERALYLATPSDVLAVLGRQPAAARSLLIVGHNPGISELANLLARDFTIDDMPTAAVVALDFATHEWVLGPGEGRLAFYDFPKNHESAITPR